MQRYTKKHTTRSTKRSKLSFVLPCVELMRYVQRCLALKKHKKLIAQEMLYNKHYKYHTRIPYKTIIQIEEKKNMKIRMFVSVLNVS